MIGDVVVLGSTVSTHDASRVFNPTLMMSPRRLKQKKPCGLVPHGIKERESSGL